MAERGAAIATLRFSHVGVALDDRTILHDVSLEVADGTLCAVIGASGAGKTTLLRVAAGLAAHTGRVLLDGSDVSAVAPHRRGVAMLFQDPRLFDSMRVVDNVAYAARVRGVRRAERRANALTLLDEVGLADRACERPAVLSGGERQRIALARALTADPQLLLLDEPLSALDAPRRAETRRVIERVRRARRLTTLYVSHDLADAIDGADHLAVVVHGAIAQHDTPAAILERPANGQVARLTGNPNVLVDGSTVFTVRPEHVALDVPGTVARVVAVERRVTHDLVTLDSPWGALHAITTANRAPQVGASTTVALPEQRRWPLPRTDAPPNQTWSTP